MIPQAIKDGMGLTSTQKLNIILTEIEVAPRNSEVGRLYEELIVLNGVVRSRFPDSFRYQFANFLYHEVLRDNGRWVVPMEYLAYDSLSQKLHGWLEREAYFSGTRNARARENYDESLPIKTPEENWGIAKLIALRQIGLHKQTFPD